MGLQAQLGLPSWASSRKNEPRMANRDFFNNNVVTLPRAGGRRVAATANNRTPSLDTADERHVADGKRLIQSFMAIEDTQLRASIIRIVEEIAENSPVFKK